MRTKLLLGIAAAGIVVIAVVVLSREDFVLPTGEAERLSAPATSTSQRENGTSTTPLDSTETIDPAEMTSSFMPGPDTDTPVVSRMSPTQNEVFVTDDTKHSIPIDDILSGGPGKDGIPSIDEPKFVDAAEAAEWLDDEEIGLGLSYRGVDRFYPFQVLVWHEIVNDTVVGDPLLVTYCPLCQTGIVFDRTVNGVPVEFGVSGMLWQSNLLMYNRTETERESLWSQVLGEAVVGPRTGEVLTIVPSDVVRFGDWQKEHPDTDVLSRDTGTLRNYGTDPYEGYYESREVSFGAEFSDERLHPKAFVLGIELDGRHKAYEVDALPLGTVTDEFAGETITITKNDVGEVRMTVDGAPIPTVGGFWFSWLAVHPDSEVYN